MTDVSVIVIGYNDAARLPRAVRSVLGQSHRSVEAVIVDDASTDRTPRVADALASAHPDRVRVIHRRRNSGGCGAPRNDGIDAARGGALMFLDSDDTLDRHACRNLLAAAEETGADLVSGCCWRVFPAENRERAWYRGVYRERAVYASVRERPDLLYDTLCTNKLYRRDLLDREDLRFVPDLHYEDLLFSTRAYLAARRIAIIPHRVYNWVIEENGRAPSITNQRADLRNFADRLEIFRRIDAVYARHGAADLKLSKDVKFLNHDLLLYVRDLRRRGPEFRARFLALARDHLAALDPRAYGQARELPAIVGFMIAQGDLAGAVSAADCVARRGDRPRLTTPLAERDGRVYWTADHLGTEQGRRVLDVTELGIHALPLRKLHLGGRVREIRRAGGHRNRTYRLSGDVADPLGRIRSAGRLRARLEFRDRRRPGRCFGVPATVTPAGDRVRWHADVRPGRDLRPFGLVDQSWGLALRLTAGEDELPVRLLGDAAAGGAALPVRPRLTRLTGDHLEPYVPESGEMALRLVAHRPAGRAFLCGLRRLAATGRGARWWRGFLRAERAARGLTGRRALKIAVYRKVFMRLPVRRDLILFESHLGRRYADNPRHIYEALRESGAPYTPVWSHAGEPHRFPDDARLVRRDSWAYYLALARAAYWVDNQGFPRAAGKRPQTIYIQTWHGSAYKLMGMDAPEVKAGSRAARDRLREMADRFDYFLVRSEHDVRTLMPGLGVRAEPLRCGYPRNDPLVRGEEPDGLRRRLGLDDGRTVVLYAPTFRAGPDGRPESRFVPPLDLERFARELGETHVLLVRPHYLSTVAVPPGLRGTVRDVSGLPDVTSLMLLSDVLVTDYSSIMFDYALLDRPMVFFVPDLDDYTRTRGAYFDLAEEAPGPVVATPDELLATLAGLRPDADAARRRAFAARYGEYDRGSAAERIVRRFFAGTGDHG